MEKLAKAREWWRERRFHLKFAVRSADLLNEMLGELKLSHFGVSKNPNEPEQDKNATAGDYLGLELRLHENQIVIFEVVQNSPAERAGLKPGMILTSYEGEALSEIIADLELTPKSTPLHRLTSIRSILNKLSSPSDGKTTLKIADSNKVFDFEPGFYQGEKGMMFGNQTPIPFFFESRLVGEEQNIRLLTFDIFLIELMPRINQAIAQAYNENEAGLVIDLRGNPGGIGLMASGVIGRLIDKELDLGDMINANGNIPFHAFPQKEAYLGPVAVLVDSFSASTSEIFAAALQEHQRARLFGRPTTGAVLPSFIEELPNGDRFQYAIGNYITDLHKAQLEGKGVTPDQVIPLNPTSLLAGGDPDLEAAILWLEKQSSQ